MTALTTTTHPWLRRGSISLLGGVALSLAVPFTAHAHVGVVADTTAAGSSAVLTLSVPHGCEGSPTTRITMAVPAGVNEVVPTVDPGWKVTKTTRDLARPITLEDGDRLTERTSQVVWTARTPLPDGFRAALSFQVELPADAAGQTLAFPVVQTCATGSTDWSQVAAAGVSEDDLEHPAPSITVTAADEPGHHGGSHDADQGAALEATGGDSGVGGATPTSVDDTVLASSEVAADGTSALALGVAGLVTGLLGLAAGVVALARTRAAAEHRRRG